jgi:hypothetical protein
MLKTMPYRLASKTEVTDGVSLTTNYTYNDDGNLPVKPLNSPLAIFSLVNSDGKTTITRNKYITDPSVSMNCKQTMIDRNIIANPVETTVEVASVLTNGNEKAVKMKKLFEQRERLMEKIDKKL